MLGFITKGASGWDPYSEPDADRLIKVAASLTVGINHVNWYMGL